MNVHKKRGSPISELPLIVINLNWQRFALPYVPRTVPSTLVGLTSGFGMFPGISLPHLPPITFSLNTSSTNTYTAMKERTRVKIFSTSQLNASQHLHFWPIELLVSQFSSCLRKRYLVLEGASHLDAFSGYPCRT